MMMFSTKTIKEKNSFRMFFFLDIFYGVVDDGGAAAGGHKQTNKNQI